MTACLEPWAIRLHAEDPKEEPQVGVHARSCERCRRLLDLARREEAALRAALPVEPPRDLLERTLGALRRTSERRPAQGLDAPVRRRGAPKEAWSRPPWGLLAAVIAALAVGAYIHSVPSAPSTGAPAPRATHATESPSPGPTPGRSAAATPGPSPGATPSPEASPSPEPTPSPDEIVPGPSPQRPLETPPGPGPSPAATPGASPAPGEVVASRGRTLGRVRSGKLTAKGHALSPGDPLPADEPLEAQGTVELEGEGTVALVLAARSKVTIHGSPDADTFAFAAGSRVLARTAGSRGYALETPDARVSPLGTELVLAVEPGKTRVSLLDGRARVEDERGRVEVREGFETEVARGRSPEAPRPFAAAKAVAWLPEALRPKTLPGQPRVLRAFTFDEGLEGATRGEAVAGGARGSRGCVRGVAAASDYALVVEIEDTRAGVVTTAPDVWLEASVKVDRRARVALQLWDVDAKENYSFCTTVEPGKWVTVTAPLRSFTDPAGKPRAAPVPAGHKGTCFSVFAGEPGEKLELLVDDVRFSQER